jgi:hypothetical protein
LRRVELNERADDDRRRCPCREHKRLFHAQVQERMSGVKESPTVPFASDAYYHPN